MRDGNRMDAYPLARHHRPGALADDHTRPLVRLHFQRLPLGHQSNGLALVSRRHLEPDGGGVDGLGAPFPGRTVSRPGRGVGAGGGPGRPGAAGASGAVAGRGTGASKRRGAPIG